MAAGGKIKGFKPHAVAFLGYLISHESHHRGQAGWALKASGKPARSKNRLRPLGMGRALKPRVRDSTHPAAASQAWPAITSKAFTPATSRSGSLRAASWFSHG